MRVKAAVLLCLIVLLTGCKSAKEPLDRALALRNQIAESNGCSFHTTVTADYGEKLYTFEMDCQTDKEGNLTFTVTKPDTIAGITGKVSAAGGALTFDDKVLAFQDMADGQVTPVAAPWLFINSLKSGYLKGCGEIHNGIEISIDDSYRDDALHLIVSTDADVPNSAEIFWKGRRVLTLAVDNFVYL